MVDDEHSDFGRVLVGFILFMVGVLGELFFGDLTIVRACWSCLLLLGFLLFTVGVMELIRSVNLGHPIPFHRLEQNQVYEVLAKTSTHLLIIIIEPTATKGIVTVAIPECLGKKLEIGERFVRAGFSITKLPS